MLSCGVFMTCHLLRYHQAPSTHSRNMFPYAWILLSFEVAGAAIESAILPWLIGQQPNTCSHPILPLTPRKSHVSQRCAYCSSSFQEVCSSIVKLPVLHLSYHFPWLWEITFLLLQEKQVKAPENVELGSFPSVERTPGGSRSAQDHPGRQSSNSSWFPQWRVYIGRATYLRRKCRRMHTALAPCFIETSVSVPGIAFLTSFSTPGFSGVFDRHLTV